MKMKESGLLPSLLPRGRENDAYRRGENFLDRELNSGADLSHMKLQFVSFQLLISTAVYITG